MPSNPSTSEMGRRHVERAAGVLGCVPSAGSGNRWQNPADGRSGHDDPYPLALEGKSTRGKSLTITLEMLAKLREQSLGENPVLPMCWYGTDDLTEVTEDWAAVPLPFLADVLDSAREWAAMTAWILDMGNLSEGADQDDMPALVRAMAAKSLATEGLRKSLADAEQALGEAQQALIEAGRALAFRDEEIRQLRKAGPGGRPADPSSPVPALPWTVVYMLPVQPGNPKADNVAAMAVRHDEAGGRVTERVHEVLVERSMTDRPRLFIDRKVVRRGDLYTPDGILLARVWDNRPDQEQG